MARNQDNLLVASEPKDYLLRTLLAMLKEKNLSAISISELCSQAGVSRMTFYRNYQATEDILIMYLHDIMTQYWSEDSISLEDNYFDKKYLIHCFAYFYEYRDFLEGLISAGFGDLFVDALTEYIEAKWEINASEEHYSVLAFVGILYSVYKNWMHNAYNNSIHDMAALVEAFCTSGIKTNRE